MNAPKSVERDGLLPLASGNYLLIRDAGFAAWGLIAAFAPRFRDSFSSLRHAGRFHGRSPGTARIARQNSRRHAGGSFRRPARLFVTDAPGDRFPAFLTPIVGSYQQLLLGGFFLGLAGSSFAAGVGFVSRWFSAEKQGSALGVYGLGNIGQSAAVFLGPLIALSFGWHNIFRGMAVILAVWAVIFWTLARNAPVVVRPKSLGEMLSVLAKGRLSWALSGFYFLTFGGFVAFSIYLPSLLKDQFHLPPADAGFRTAGFVVLATLLRPVGGWLSDKIGGARVLSAVFAVVIPFALLLAVPSMLPFTIGALGCAVLMGL